MCGTPEASLPDSAGRLAKPSAGPARLGLDAGAPIRQAGNFLLWFEELPAPATQGLQTDLAQKMARAAAR